MKLKPLVGNAKSIASFLSSLPCLLHVYLLQLLALNVHMFSAGAGPALWLRQEVDLTLDTVGQLKSVHPPATLLLRHIPSPGGLAGPLIHLFITLDRAWTISASRSCPCQVPRFCQFPGAYDSDRHGETTSSDRNSIPLWRKIDSSKQFRHAWMSPVTDRPNHPFSPWREVLSVLIHL